MIGPNRYDILKAEHDAANAVHEQQPEPRDQEPAAPYVPSIEEQIEARLAAYEFVEGRKHDAGLISTTDYFHDLRQLDQDIARELGGMPPSGQFGTAIFAPDADQTQRREAAPEPSTQDHEAEREAAIVERLGPDREISDIDREKIDKLLDRASDEMEMKLEQGFGEELTRGRSR